MTQAAPAPVTLRSAGTRLMSPTSSRTLGFVACSSTASASHASGLSDRRSNNWIGGKRDRIMRHIFGHTILIWSGPGCSCGIDICPDCRQIRYITCSHTPQRRLAAEKIVRSGNPRVGQLRIGVNDLKRLPNTGDIANAPEGILRQFGRWRLLPGKKSANSRRAEDNSGLLVIDVPKAHNFKKAFKRKSLARARNRFS